MESFSSFSDCWSYASLKNFRQISPAVQTHLKLFYVTLCCVLMALAAGACVHIIWNIGVLLPILATFGCIFWLHTAPPYEEAKWFSLVMTLFLLLGASVAPIIKLAINMDPRIFVSELMGGAIACACFSGASMLSTRRGFLYHGAILSSGVLIFFWLHFASKIFEGEFAFFPYASEIFDGEFAFFPYELYFGLLVGVGSMVVQTQVLAHEIWIDLFCWKVTKEEYYGEKLDSTTN